MGKLSSGTKPTQFRLLPHELAILDAIAAKKTTETGVTFTRTDAVRLAAAEYARSHGITIEKRKK